MFLACEMVELAQNWSYLVFNSLLSASPLKPSSGTSLDFDNYATRYLLCFDCILDFASEGPLCEFKYFAGFSGYDLLIWLDFTVFYPIEGFTELFFNFPAFFIVLVSENS